jgi:hypothetical protein
MEVHTHTHSDQVNGGTSRKKWTHYLWEFLMLFLAVFCGFLAENLREHRVEREREKQYMESLLVDLQKDTTLLSSRIQFRYERVMNFDTLLYWLKNKDLREHTGSVYLAGFLAPVINRFLSNDGTLQQLKNAGGLRLVRKKDIADSILVYDREINWVADFENWEKERFANLSVYEKVFDAAVFERNLIYGNGGGTLTIKLPEGSPLLLSYNKNDLDQLYNRVQMQKRVNIVTISAFKALYEKAVALIILLKNRYHLS